MSIVLKAQSPS